MLELLAGGWWWREAESLVLLIALAKSRSTRRASHHPAFMSSCLTIIHACLPCVPGRGVSPCFTGVIEGGEDDCGAVNVGCK